MKGKTMSRVIRGSSSRALDVLKDCGLTFSEAVDLLQEAHDKRDKVVSKKKARLISHSDDGTYSAGPK